MPLAGRRSILIQPLDDPRKRNSIGIFFEYTPNNRGLLGIDLHIVSLGALLAFPVNVDLADGE